MIRQEAQGLMHFPWLHHDWQRISNQNDQSRTSGCGNAYRNGCAVACIRSSQSGTSSDVPLVGVIVYKNQPESTLLLTRMLVFMCFEITQNLGWIGWIGTEAQAADRTGVVTGPDALAFPVCHYCCQADFFGWLIQFQSIRFLCTLCRTYDRIARIPP
jgi:hypothetical protein